MPYEDCCRCVNKKCNRREVHLASRLDVKVWRAKRNKRKRQLVGSVFLTLGDLVRKQTSPGSSEYTRLRGNLGCLTRPTSPTDISLDLKRPPTLKEQPTGCSSIIIRLTPSLSSRASSSASQLSTLVASDSASDHGDQRVLGDETTGLEFSDPTSKSQFHSYLLWKRYCNL